MAFAFYDFETTGTSPAFDQPLQFAAILTDNDFNELERVNLRCRLAPHILPSPMAMAITGISPIQMVDPTLPSWFEFAVQLRELIERWAPATWTGYNSIAFDEEIFRQTFYQNLQPNLYETQFHGNDRLDIMKVVYAAWVKSPRSLNWPTGNNGQIVFKLDQLAPHNGFTQHDAHDALGDVEATIHIARLLRDRAPTVWSQALESRDKRSVIEALETGAPMALIERFSGPPRERIGCFCGFHAGNANRVGFFNLEGNDPAEYLDADDDVLDEAVGKSPIRIRSLATNKSPLLFELDAVNPVVADRAALIASRPDFHKRVGQAMARRYADAEPPAFVEQQIYQGFYSSEDQSALRSFQTASWPERLELARSFEDARLKYFGLRLAMIEQPNLFSADQLVAAAFALKERWKHCPDGRNGWSTFDSVDGDMVEVEKRGLLNPNELADLREFFEKRREYVEAGKFA